MKPFRLKFLCTACLAGALWLSPMHDGSDALAASAQQKAAQEKKRVEGQRANIEQKLQSLQAELDAREARSEEASQRSRPPIRPSRRPTESFATFARKSAGSRTS